MSTNALAYAFARQALADFRTYRDLERETTGRSEVPVCHRLLFLQMACEKLSRARLYKQASDIQQVYESHTYSEKQLPVILREMYAKRNRHHAAGHLLEDFRRLAASIQVLAPAARAGGSRLDNCEYPWSDGTGGIIIFDKLGRGWVWRQELPCCIHQNHVFRARPVSGELHPEFVSHFTNTFGQLYFLASGKQTTNLASVSMTRVKACPVPLPPAAEMREVVESIRAALGRVEEMQEFRAEVASALTTIDSAILAKAFRGELVPQDPAEARQRALGAHPRRARSRNSQLQGPLQEDPQ